MATITAKQALRQAVMEEMQRDPKMFVIGVDVCTRGGTIGTTLGFDKLFGNHRVFNAPISEPSFIGAGIGAAVAGARPFIELLYSDWITLGMDQIVNMAAKLKYMFGGQINLPLVIHAPNGAGGGNAAQHSQSMEAWFQHVPGLKLITPIEPYDIKGMMKSAIRDNNPVLVFTHKKNYDITGEVPDAAYTVPLGKAAVRRTGNDVSLIAYGVMALRAQRAAQKLAQAGIHCDVIDLRSIVPLDYDTVMASVKKTGRAVVCQEASLRGGIASDIVSEIVERGYEFLKSRPVRVGAPNVPVPFNRGLERAYIPDEEDIIQAVVNSICANA